VNKINIAFDLLLFEREKNSGWVRPCELDIVSSWKMSDLDLHYGLIICR
jgi:hypothetical protein